MQSLLEYQSLFATLWVVWFFVLFAGILVWTLRPSRKTSLAQHAHIPFRESDQ